MKKTVAVVAGLAVFAALAGLSGRAWAADAPSSPADRPFVVKLRVGQVFEVCKSGEVICPIVRHICDDLKVANVVDTPDGLGIKGVGAGTTLCVASGSTGPGRLFRITVRGSHG